ncbi:unnamed protein product [Albugo candida]|nr:unnamed protein product [Albugo candida]|eukprot:CCI40885.1 unnamed protein product [Albugo candida]
MYLCTLWGLIAFASLSELGYILRLNKGKGHGFEEGFMRDILTSDLTHTLKKQAIWTKKWTQLVKQFKRKQTEPTFEALVRLYAHREGAMKRLDVAYAWDPVEFEFYLPQLCSFLLLGAFKRGPQLSAILLSKCSVSHVFAHKMLWYLNSYCVGNSRLARGGSIEYLDVLIEQVLARGVEPARAIDELRSGSPLQEQHDNSAIDMVTSAFSTRDPQAGNIMRTQQQEEEALLPAREDHYQTFDDFLLLEMERGASAHIDPFQRETTFLEALIKISSSLLSVPYRSRNDKLHEWLSNIQSEYLPSNSLYLPVGNPYHRLKRIHVTESFTFSTRERVPFLLCAEVVDYVSPQQKHVPRKKSSIFGGRTFPLGLWEKPSAQIDIRQGDKSLPETDILGFWSESCTATSPRLRHLKSSITQSSELLNGIFGSLVGKAPQKEAANDTETMTDMSADNEACATHHKTYECDITDPQAGKTDQFASTINAYKDGQTDITTDELWSPRSDILSPQSQESQSPTSRLRGRCDSTDHLLQQLLERDSKLAEEDDEGTLTTKRSSRADPPHVIFKERWTDKEARLRVNSNWGHLPGWRLLPVIIKSNDDLRQEQFAAQLMKQFHRVFEEAKLPVFMRPYDVIAISPSAGIVEAIADTISIHSLKQNVRFYTTLLDFYVHRFGDSSSSEFRKARNNFVCSMAAYSMVSYLLQIKDRHNGNLLLDAEGHIIHIDFGYILSNNPGNVAFESAPFKLTNEFVELMGGPRSASFRRFRSLCVRSFLIARKYRHRFLLLVEMMLSGNEHLPCFAGDPKGTMERFESRFQPQLDINACEDFVHDLIDASLNNWRTKWYDKYQRWCVGVF